MFLYLAIFITIDESYLNAWPQFYSQSRYTMDDTVQMYNSFPTKVTCSADVLPVFGDVTSCRTCWALWDISGVAIMALILSPYRDMSLFTSALGCSQSRVIAKVFAVYIQVHISHENLFFFYKCVHHISKQSVDIVWGAWLSE